MFQNDIKLINKVMQNYANNGGDSGITHYQMEIDNISIKFKDGAVYTYTDNKCGKNHIDEMKRLAQHGSGLHSYLTLNCKECGQPVSN